MAYSIRLLEDAQADIAQLLLSFDANAPKKGAMFFERLDSATARLRELPEMFPVYDLFPIYRRIVIMDWLVFYCVDTENQRIDIHRILDGRMKMPDRLLA